MLVKKGGTNLMMKVKEVAELVGISVRTLHHYDEIGLLRPTKVTTAGYRLYADKDLETLQQILFFKELGFPLKKVKEIMGDPDYNKEEALQLQKNLLLEKRNRYDRMIHLINKTIQETNGGIPMSNKERFEGFDFQHNPYEQEARERYGDHKVDEMKKRLNHYSEKERESMSEQWDVIYKQLASLREQSVKTDEVQSAIGDWYTYLNENFGTYSPEAYRGLGQMYVEDERFTKNIDKYGEGLARFMRDAMAVYADRKK